MDAVMKKGIGWLLLAALLLTLFPGAAVAEEETGIELESETSETVGGFIIDLMGEIPKENVKYPSISYGDYDFTIVSVRDRRIEKLRIEIVEREEDSDD